MYEPTDLDIRSLRYDQNVKLIIASYSMEYIDLTTPKFVRHANIPFNIHEVMDHEEGRIDLIMESMYGSTIPYYESIDIILHINHIDNPLSIRAGMELLYPDDPNLLDQYRYENIFQEDSKNTEVARSLGYPNKVSRADSARTAYVENGYALPPTVNASGKPSVTSDSTKIYVGGLK